jgi:hypothetical protein
MTNRILRLVCTSAIFFTIALPPHCAQAAAIPQTKTPAARGAIFVFHTDEFWLNLHHFLYVLGRARNKEVDASREAVAAAPVDQDRGLSKLNAEDQGIWHEVVAAYAAGPSKKDLVFDDSLSAVTKALARAGDNKSLDGSEVDPAIAAILERAAPIYRRAWWRTHHDGNRNWQKGIQALVDRHGAAVLAFITRAYQLQWPTAGFPVHVSAYSNWAGAYSVTGNLLVISSGGPDTQADYGLETIFHEGMHQWDEQVIEALRVQAKKLNKYFPRGLSHSLIFFTAGEAVRSVIPQHVPYAEKFGVWQRGLGPMKVAIEKVWKPYLDGHGTRDEALAELIKLTAVEPPKKGA